MTVLPGSPMVVISNNRYINNFCYGKNQMLGILNIISVVVIGTITLWLGPLQGVFALAFGIPLAIATPIPNATLCLGMTFAFCNNHTPATYVPGTNHCIGATFAFCNQHAKDNDRQRSRLARPLQRARVPLLSDH